MKNILVATDFSERSDRAIRRATLLAREFDGRMSLVHVVDDDQSRRIVQAEQREANAVLQEQVRSLREIDGLTCDFRVVLGDPFEGIALASREAKADLVVVGPHRKAALKDVFIGTTAERTIRTSDRPVLMANGNPAGPYRRILIAMDLSECSADAVRAVRTLALDRKASVSVVHVFDAPAVSMMHRASSTDDQIKDYIADEQERADGELRTFLGKLHLTPVQSILSPADRTPAHHICAAAREVSADLIVVGTRGRTGVAKILLGSVAEEVLRISDRDVLAVPPVRSATAE